MNITMLLDMAAAGMGQRRALGPGTEALTFADLRQRAQVAAAGLEERGVSTLAYLGFNSPDLPVALFAAAYAGAPFAPLNYRLPDADLRALLARTAPSLAVVDPSMLHRVQGIEGVDVVDLQAWSAGLTAKPVEEIEAPTDPDEVAVLLFTSGTTGEPKAAMLRHRHLSSYIISTLDFMGAGEEEAALVSVPPYHIAAISAALSSCYVGRRVVHLEQFTAQTWVDVVASEGISHAMVVPTMLGRILDVLQQRGETLPALRHLSYGGGAMPAPTLERALRALPHVDFVNGYGLTETSSTITVLTPQDHRDALAAQDAAGRQRLGSVGRPAESVRIEVRGENGEPLPPGQSGEIWVSGDQVSGEYVGRTSSLVDGWFPTKDFGWLDAQGYLFLGGRLDDIIVRGGENISPGEIEDVLRTHPSVADAAVVGLPDPEWGERVAAFVVAAPGQPQDAPALQELVRARLRSTKTPQEVHFRAELPYGDTGKLLRRVLKDEVVSSRVEA